MATFLSSAWLQELDVAARASDSLAALGSDGRLVIEQRVDGARSGDVVYHFVIDTDGARVVAGTAEHPALTVTADYATAVALHTGRLNAQQALASGSLTLGGDLNEVLRRADALQALDDVFTAVRASTTVG